jgi:hypothetical protein
MLLTNGKNYGRFYRVDKWRVYDLFHDFETPEDYNDFIEWLQECIRYEEDPDDKKIVEAFYKEITECTTQDIYFDIMPNYFMITEEEEI